MYKRFLLTAVLLSSLPAHINLTAQSIPYEPPGGPRSMTDRSPEQELKRLEKLLNLSEEQKAQILPLLRERANTIEKLIADQDTSMRDKFPQIIAIRDHTNEQIRALLTNPQKKKLDRMLADEKRREEAGPLDGPMSGPPPGDAPPPPPQ
jgi:hypothetical protein